MSYSISFAGPYPSRLSRFVELTVYHGMWRAPEHSCWQTVTDATGQIAECESPREAEALAGHRLCVHLNKNK